MILLFIYSHLLTNVPSRVYVGGTLHVAVADAADSVGFVVNHIHPAFRRVVVVHVAVHVATDTVRLAAVTRARLPIVSTITCSLVADQ